MITNAYLLQQDNNALPKQQCDFVVVVYVLNCQAEA